MDKLGSVDPLKSPSETFELYSVPAFPSGRPEIVTGKAIGSSKQVVFPGTVLVCKINPRINRAWVVGNFSEHPKLASTEWVAFPPTAEIEARYLSYFFRQDRFRDFLAANVSGVGGSLMRARVNALDTFPVSVAPRSEQTRIAEKLDELLSDLDAGIAALERAQTNLKRYRVAVFKAAVEGRLTEKWRAAHPNAEPATKLLERILAQRRKKWEEAQLKKYAEKAMVPPKKWKDDYVHPERPIKLGVSPLPDSWAYCSLAELLPPDRSGTRTGPFGTLLAKHEHQKSGVPVVGIENISSMRFVAGSKIHVSPEKADHLKDYELVSGDVVISRSGTVGEVCVIPDGLGDARMSTNLMRVRLVENGMRPMWFCALFSGSPTVLAQIHELCSGSTRDFLNTEILMSLVFPLPPLDEQDEILRQLESVQSELDRLEDDFGRLGIVGTRLRQSILKRAFEGKLVPQDPRDEPASELLKRIRVARETEAGKRVSVERREARSA